FSSVQRDLFAIGARLADPTARVVDTKAKAAVEPARIEALEQVIDACEETLPPLHAFILPGGTRLGALLHLGRTVCRRAERTVVALVGDKTVEHVIVAYLNRLSDLLFVLARRENARAGRVEDA